MNEPTGPELSPESGTTPEPEIKRVLLGAVPPLPEPVDRLNEVRRRVRRTRLRTGAVAVGAAAVVSALAVVVPQALLGAPAAGPPGEAADQVEVIYQGNVMVMETPERAPQLCAAAWMQTLPAQGGSPNPPCNAPDNVVAGWEWDGLAPESAGGTRWGTYFLTGSWDGLRFTLTEPVRPEDPGVLAPNHVDDFDGTSPCPVPAGGWRPVDRSTATHEALEAVHTWAAAQPDFAGIWLDQSYLDGLDPREPEDIEAAANDPTRFVLNLAFVGDLAGWESRIREIWGGPLCVSAAPRSDADLSAIETRMLTEFPFPETLSISRNLAGYRIEVEVLIVTPGLRAEFDQRYDPDAVELHGWLEPVG